MTCKERGKSDTQMINIRQQKLLVKTIMSHLTDEGFKWLLKVASIQPVYTHSKNYRKLYLKN